MLLTESLDFLHGELRSMIEDKSNTKKKKKTDVGGVMDLSNNGSYS